MSLSIRSLCSTLLSISFNYLGFHQFVRLFANVLFYSQPLLRLNSLFFLFNSFVFDLFAFDFLHLWLLSLNVHFALVFPQLSWFSSLKAFKHWELLLSFLSLTLNCHGFHRFLQLFVRVFEQPLLHLLSFFSSRGSKPSMSLNIRTL